MMIKSLTEMHQAALFDINEKIAETHELLVREKEFQRHHEELLERRLDNAIRIGQNLLDFKTTLPHGKFMTFAQTEFSMSQSTAWDYMNLAQNHGRVHDLPLRTAFELASPSMPSVVIEMVETKQIEPTVAAIREAKREVLADSFPPSTTVLDVQREIRREQQREYIAQLKEKGVSLPTGKFSCIVIDPPWQMQKIERDVRPNQVEFDYPTMSEDELKDFPLPDFSADDCHMYLWTTQKHLPLALRLTEHWGFKYQCLMTWVKNVGFTPFSWMYSTEHVLFCTRGSLPLLRLGMRLDFRANVREHSRKPDEFYEIVKEVSPGPRLDVFSREKREGFEQYGNEVEKYV